MSGRGCGSGSERRNLTAGEIGTYRLESLFSVLSHAQRIILFIGSMVSQIDSSLSHLPGAEPETTGNEVKRFPAVSEEEVGSGAEGLLTC